MRLRNLGGTAGMLAAVMASLAAASTPAPAVLSFGTNGSVRLTSGKTEIAHIVPGLFEAGWTGGSYVGASPKDIRPGLYRGKIKAKSGEVYAISPSGKRLEWISATVESEELIAKLRVAGPDGHARLAYEIVVR